MNYGKFLIFLSFFYLISCKSNEPDKEYYPVDAWIQSELAEIDSLPIAVFRYRTKNNITDTSIIDKKEFSNIATSLLSIPLNNKRTKNEFDEVLMDEGDNSNISITYTALEGSEIALKKIQVNFKPGKSNPKSIYAERVENVNKIRIHRKIIWMAGKSLSVYTSYYSEGAILNVTSEKFEWGI